MNGFTKRSIQSLIHPQKYVRMLKLTDGSTLRVSTLTPPVSTSSLPYSVSLLNLDSANHPSWNPELRDKLLLDDRGQVAKFRAKFDSCSPSSSETNTAASSDYMDFLDMDPEMTTSSVSSSNIKVKKTQPLPTTTTKGAAKKKK
jgi:ribosomal protein L31